VPIAVGAWVNVDAFEVLAFRPEVKDDRGRRLPAPADPPLIRVTRPSTDPTDPAPTRRDTP
jgi:hypothetical protein